MDNIFESYGQYNPDEIEKWSKFEDMLQAFNNLDPDEMLDEAFANSEQDDERASFVDDPAWNVEYLNEYIKILKEQFVCWIKSIHDTIKKDDYFCPNANDIILTFNYTQTVEHNFNLPKNNILHIHGTVNEEIILGHNNFQEPSLIPIDIDDDYRNMHANEMINDILTEISKLYYKNSSSIIERHRGFFNKIFNCEKIVIMGFSCGIQDQIYMDTILNYNKPIDFYYHSIDDKNQLIDYLNTKHPINIRYIKW